MQDESNRGFCQMRSNKKIDVISSLCPSAIKQNELKILAVISLGAFRQYIVHGRGSSSYKDKHAHIYVYMYVHTHTYSCIHEFRSLV